MTFEHIKLRPETQKAFYEQFEKTNFSTYDEFIMYLMIKFLLTKEEANG